MALSVTGLLPRFAGRIFSAYEARSWKPEPDLFLHAAAEFAGLGARVIRHMRELPVRLQELAAGPSPNPPIQRTGG